MLKMLNDDQVDEHVKIHKNQVENTKVLKMLKMLIELQIDCSLTTWTS